MSGKRAHVSTTRLKPTASTPKHKCTRGNSTRPCNTCPLASKFHHIHKDINIGTTLEIKLHARTTLTKCDGMKHNTQMLALSTSNISNASKDRENKLIIKLAFPAL